jgi:hypothetical protein
MPSGRKRRFCTVVLAVALTVPFLSASIIEIRQYHGKQVSCIHSGLMGFARVCGTSGFARVFAGSVKSVTEVGDFEKSLELIPDEIFLGDRSEVTAITNQACLRTEIQAGDKWLFYLYRDPKTGALVLPYDSPSKPLETADDDIAMLRNLGRASGSGILIGTASRRLETGDKASWPPLVNHKIVVKNVSTGQQYVTYTNGDGHYEFELPVGSYDLSATAERGLRDTGIWGPKFDGVVHLWEHQCLEHNFTFVWDAAITGHVTTADGKPASFAKVAIIPTVPVHPQFTVMTDKDGYFEVSGQKAGQFVVGVGLLEPYVSEEWKNRVYYPGVPTKEQAKVIELEDGEWRTRVDFALPPSSSNR